MAEFELLLLTIDSLRADRANRDAFSACWDAFETDFVRFENALANGVATPLSFPSLLTGHPAVGDGTLPPGNPTLAELYEGETWAVSNNPHLRPERNYDRGFDVFADTVGELLDGETRGNGALTDEDVTESELTPPPESADHVLAALRDGMDDRRGFFWAHFIDPHYQFKPHKIRDRDVSVGYADEEILAMNERYVDGTPTPDDLEFLTRFYEEQIAYLDRRLAAFFDWLRSQGRWNETMIVIAADHGEAFGERGIYNHRWDADPIDPLVRVPLLVKFPGNDRGGETVDRLVQNADAFATVADALEPDAARSPNTRPLTDDGRRIVVSKSTGAVRVTTADGTAIRRRDGSTAIEGPLGDDAMAALESALIPAIEKLSGTVPGLDDADRSAVEQRLEDLGYR